MTASTQAGHGIEVAPKVGATFAIAVLMSSGASFAQAAEPATTDEVSPELTSLIEFMETTPEAELDAMPSSASFYLTGEEFVEAVEGGWMEADSATYQAAARAGVGCSRRVNQPHVSSGAGGVIAKVRVTCQIYGATTPSTISVRMVGSITFTPNPTTIKARVAATADYSQSVKTDGTEMTYYIPQAGGNAGTASGRYRACATITPAGGGALAMVCATWDK
jgi:hypothetical protein